MAKTPMIRAERSRSRDRRLQAAGRRLQVLSGGSFPPT